MIRAEELRIGNLLYFKNTKDVAKVELIHNKHFDCRDEYGLFTPNGNYEPIPITEEILVEWLGCRKDGDKFWAAEMNLLFLIWDGSDFCLCHQREPEYVRAYVNTLHHWQNIVHALTGQELTIKPK